MKLAARGVFDLYVGIYHLMSKDIERVRVESAK
jgi:hypothetical protein